MVKKLLISFLAMLALVSTGFNQTLASLPKAARPANTETLEKMIVGSGTVDLNVDMTKLNGGKSRSTDLRFDIARDSFLKVLVLNGELRGPLPGTMGITLQGDLALPGHLGTSSKQLMIENTSWGGQFDLVVRDSQTGFTFFNIEGYELGYDAGTRGLTALGGRVLISREFANELGRPSDAGSIVGKISVAATLKPIEISQLVDGQVVSDELPAIGPPVEQVGTVPGPDVIVGDLSGLAQFGSASGTQVGLAVGTDSCNAGTENLHWFQLPDNDHPVIPQNLYRMSGGPSNNDRFEQVGQSSVKHAFTALTNNICSYGCNGVGGPNLGSGCSDPYSAGLNAGPNLGSRAWINPYTGFYPRGDSATPPNDHNGHSHTGPSHRILTEIADLNTTLNPGATYYAESQYVTAHEYSWCTTHPGQCNMNNNVSYRQYSVIGTGTTFTFSPVGATNRQKSAVSAWTGSTSVGIQPAPLQDGIGAVAYKVTNPSPGVWHYEYAVYNQNMDRAIQAFSVAVGSGASISNVGFHAPPQHPGWSGDGTAGNAGFSSAAWAQSITANSVGWNSETLAQNANANAIRWGTMYNFRFDSDRAPQLVNATVGFFKTGAPITIQVQGPSSNVAAASVSGRVKTSSGSGVKGALVTMTDSMGTRRTVVTSSFGYYTFDNVATGVTYTVSVESKRYSFTPQTMAINDNITNLDFIAAP